MALTPENLKEIYINSFDFDSIEEEIDAEMIENHTQHPWEEAIIEDEYDIDIRNAVAKRYANAGWNFVYHQTSTENDERPGLTFFAFSQTPVEHFENEKYHKVTRRMLNNE